MPRRRAALAVLAAALVGLAGCGSEDDPFAFPPPAGPAASPPAEARPEGDVVRVGRRALDVAVDPRSGRVAVLTSDPRKRLGDEVVLLDAETLAEQRRIPVPGLARPGTLAVRDGAFQVAYGPPTSLLTIQPRTGRAVSSPIGTLADAGLVRRLLAPAEVAPVADGGPLATIDDRRRRLSLLSRAGYDLLATEPAGVGPTQVVAGADGRVYVTDTGGESVLLFRTDPELTLARRYGLPGAPYATTIDRERGKLWVTLTGRNEVVQLTADGQPREQRRFDTVRQPDAIAVDETTGRVFITGRTGGELQAFDGYATDGDAPDGD